MADLVAAFESEGGEELAQIAAAVADGEAAALVQAAHRLKGSALNLGCQAMAETAGELESLGRTGALAGSDALVERLAREFEQTLALLRIETAAA
jgi:HPt (histidine-containing phosphotransfer) domain-containing protein